ncbi:Ldh family oxidoreductase [Salibacterium halotolerans]|uniref:Malate/lactate/ureidoglycolate dehydrogenase, LDH2 family n=1 Tax=Salibacterium halotolerans TaxID=1884432 RepID=A0A1I5LCU7_9BACI|nr:Ldh family oxidoreductase [Salibacterium halotolerans]SFO95120.1 Malate/lactate/ureidoglycolate dehydrogenase, LDH2 family [Salibacterium halotolerans]
MEKRYESSVLQQFSSELLQQTGMPGEEAEITADSLVRADMEGARTHGVNRLLMYVPRLEEKQINPNPEPMFEEQDAVLNVHGDNGLGQVVSSHALEHGFSIAKRYGTASVFISGSNHFGTAAYYCQKAFEQDMALITVTNSPSGIAPWGGSRAYFGTNPLAFGFPHRKGEPIIIDMSSSVVARGNILVAEKEGKEIPGDWALDPNGVPTTDPSEAIAGSLLPMGGAKGYAMALAVEMMAGVLTGAAFGSHVNSIFQSGNPPADVGHGFILLNIRHWMEMERYEERVAQMLSEIKSSPLAEGFEEILYPGERRARSYEKSRAVGIPLTENIERELQNLASTYGLSFPDPL